MATEDRRLQKGRKGKKRRQKKAQGGTTE